MPHFSGLPSYAFNVVTRKLTFCIFLGFLAAKVGPVTSSASTPSLASSVTVQTYSAVSPSAVSPTQTSAHPSSTAGPSLPQNVSFQISIQLTQTTWSEDLFNKNSSRFVGLATNLTTAVLAVLRNVGDASVDVVEIKPGSVIAILKVTTSSSNENLMKSQLRNEMEDGNLGGFSVDPTLYSGAVFDVVLEVKFVCNDSAVDKGFDRKGDFKNAINTLMSTHPKFVAANIQHIKCLEEDNITMVTARVQINDPSVANPNKELSSLKTAVDAGQVGNFSVVPEWASYIPGEKLFHVRASLQSESSDTVQTRKDVETFIADAFKGKANFRYANIDVPDNKTVAIEIGMSLSASELPILALDHLDNSLRTATLGSLIKLVKRTIRVTIDPKSVTRKIFEVTFHQNVPNCNATDIADTNSLHYKNLSMGIWDFIDSNIRANNFLNKLYLETKVKKLSCHNTTTVRGVSDFYMKSNTEDKIGQFLWPFYKCKKPGIYDWGIKVLLRTPTLPDTLGTWLQLLGVYTHWVCPRRKPPTPPPTSLSPSTGNPTITGIPANATEPPSQNTTEPTATSEALKPSTTKATLPTQGRKPELYVKLKLGMTWGEFCSKRETLKKRIAQNVHDRSGTEVSPDRIIHINVERNCADPSKKNELAEVWFYVSKSGSKDVQKYLTLKVYKMFQMFFENGNTKQLGPDFEEKVVEVELAGSNASNYENNGDSKMPTWTIILIAVAGAFGLLLMLLACCCLFCCGRRRRRRSRKYGSSEHPAHALHVIHVDNGDLASAGTKDKQNRDKNAKKDNNKKGMKEGEGENVKGDKDKRGHTNDGYDDVNDNNSDNKNNNNGNNKNAAGKENFPDEDDKSATGRTANPLGNDNGNAYGDLKTNGVGDHTYASINKPGSVKNGSGDKSSNVANVPVIVPPAPPDPALGSGSRGVGADSNNKEDGSSGANSSGAGNGGEKQNNGSRPNTPVSLRKADADPKNQDRRGSYVNMHDDENVPLTHKTGTVGIVALAIRNRNGQKKETEFKNLNKDVPNQQVNYPPETSSKNRFPDVLPAPKTRVTLSTQPDYINANWIRDHKGLRCYIATQHPLHETVDDFWRMVWDQQANTVVMVNDKEKEKPAEFMDYLPKGEGNSKRYGSIDVTIKQTTEKADYILTVLSIAESKSTSSPREVSHFRFTSWKERAVPNVALFVGFVTSTREARKKYGETKAPTIVHCSDGLGFTGVYIAVDIGIKSHEESKTSVVDVFELSKNLRRDRHGIVCSLEQYNFIYEALYEYTVNYDKSDK